MTPAITGLWPPVSTPFADDGAVDARRLVHHSRTLLADGAHGLAILGTTSEANSLTLDERR
ncbi:MAG TPA: dihydrodipicolinate synthase family protein, partial [Bauldia sp.]|nr:dihydrodipicolinate synthase family protein [Bauldia sp.]